MEDGLSSVLNIVVTARPLDWFRRICVRLVSRLDHKMVEETRRKHYACLLKRPPVRSILRSIASSCTEFQQEKLIELKQSIMDVANNLGDITIQ